MAAHARTPSALMWLRVNHLMVYTSKLVVKTVYMPLIRNLRYMSFAICIQPTTILVLSSSTTVVLPSTTAVVSSRLFCNTNVTIIISDSNYMYTRIPYSAKFWHEKTLANWQNEQYFFTQTDFRFT